MQRTRSLFKNLLLFILIVVTLLPTVTAQNFNQIFSFQYKYGIQDQELYVSIPISLYDYYSSLDRIIRKDADYASFVTPDPFIDLAYQIRTYIGNKTREDELFANAVLTLIHQLRYEDNVNETKYPIETIVNGEGKCDTLSFLAASIMKAGGLDVVLFYFKDVYHMTVGVHLPYEPFGTYWWQQSGDFQFEGKKYWIAESTPLMDWKVGDIPPLLQDQTPLIISLANNPDYSPAQVSSKIGEPLNFSSISIYLSSSSNFSSNSRLLQVEGSIFPPQINESVVLYLSEDGISYKTLSTKTDKNGNYSISWNSTINGILYIRTSWEGNSRFSGADSELVQIFLGFSKSIVQFETDTFYYLYGFPGASSFELENRKGLDDFLNIQINKTGIFFSGKILVFTSGQLVTISKNSEYTLNPDEIFWDSRLQPLRLPDDINQITNDQFALIFRNNENGTYLLDMKGLNDYDLYFSRASDNIKAIIVNASSLIQENIWYNLEARIYDNRIIGIITDEYGYPIKYFNEVKTNESDNISLMLLLTNKMSQVVAIKDLSIKPLETDYEESSEESFTGIYIYYPYVIVILIVGLILAIIIRKRDLNKLHFFV